MAEETMSTNFIHSIIEEELQPGGPLRGETGPHPVPAGAQRLPPHRPLQGPDHRLRHRGEYGGICNLRMDDTNPAKEDTEYVDAIQEDIHWLGFDWGTVFSTARTTLNGPTSWRWT